MIGTLIAKYKAEHVMDALNRRDLDAFLRAWAADATFIYPGDVPSSGRFDGIDAIRNWYERWAEQFPSACFTVKDTAVASLFDLRGNNVIAVHWEVDAINRGGFCIHNSGVTLVTTSRGKVVRVEEFIFDTGDRFRTAWSAPHSVHRDVA